MKIVSNTLFAAFFLLSFCLHSFAGETRVTQLFVTDSGQEYRHTFLYNSAGAVQLETRYIQSGNDSWERQSQTEWYYGQGSCTSRVEREYIDFSWRNVEDVEYRYDESGRLEEENYFSYPAGSREQIRRIKLSYDYGRLSKKEEYIWTEGVEQLSVENSYSYAGGVLSEQSTRTYSSGILVKEFLSVYEYNSRGLLHSMVLKEKAGISWVNSDSTTWHYNAASLPVLQRTKRWIPKINNWENAQSLEYEYNAASELISETCRQWSGMFWENICRYEYVYNNGVQIRKTLALPLYREWRNVFSIHYSDFVDDKARTIRSEYDFWGGEQGRLTLSYIPFLFNDDLVVRKAESIRINYDKLPPDTATDTPEDAADMLIKVYPNPSDGIFYLNTEKHQIISWDIYNIKGQLVKSHVQRFSTGVIDITELANGMYILRVHTAAGYQQQKLIKE